PVTPMRWTGCCGSRNRRSSTGSWPTPGSCRPPPRPSSCCTGPCPGGCGRGADGACGAARAPLTGPWHGHPRPRGASADEQGADRLLLQPADEPRTRRPGARRLRAGRTAAGNPTPQPGRADRGPRSGMMDETIRTEALVKNFGRTRALDGLDLVVHTGEVHGFLGPNGAGKTTTLRVLLGLLKADGGTARLLGGDPGSPATELHRRPAYVPGDVTLWPNLSGGEVIDLLGRLRGG